MDEEHEHGNSVTDEGAEEFVLENPETGESTSITEGELASFVGEKSYHYLPIFKKFNVAGRDKFAVTWNWASFFLSVLWMVYRKMYLWAFFAMAGVWFLYAGLGLLLRFLGLVPLTGLPFGLAILLGLSIRVIPMIGFGILGNYIYYKRAKQKITRWKRAGMHKSLAEMGGVSPKAAGLVIVIAFILGILLEL